MTPLPPSPALRSRTRRRFLSAPGRHAGFTLIELLIVVAIIAILAAIAVPNFLEAQTRAKVSRVRADLRTIATALEAYAVDANRYPPNDGKFNVVPMELTTPVAYLGGIRLADPFCEKELDPDPNIGELARYYTYDLILSGEEWAALMALADRSHVPPSEAVDSPAWNPGALDKYGRWRLVSNGPDRAYADPGFVFGADPLDPNGVLKGADVVYDPTNGAVSRGNLILTQKSWK